MVYTVIKVQNYGFHHGKPYSYFSSDGAELKYILKQLYLKKRYDMMYV